MYYFNIFLKHVALKNQTSLQKLWVTDLDCIFGKSIKTNQPMKHLQL